MTTEDFKLGLADRMHRLPPYIFGELNAIRAARRRAGEDVIDLGMGNPNDPTPELVIDKLCDVAQDPASHRYAASADGIRNLKREVAAFYDREWGVELDPEQEVACTIGSKEGISHLALAVMEHGRLAFVPSPAFPVHIYSVILAGGGVVNIPLGNGPEFLDRLRYAIETLDPRPTMLVINFPHNPTGLTVERDFFQRVVDIAREYDIFVVHDFAYSHITFDGYRAPSFLQAEGAKGIGVEFTSMSKSFNMAGWRVGYCVGNRDAISALTRLKGYYDYGLFVPVQVASIVALRHARDAVTRQAKTYQDRRDVLCDGLERIGWPVEPPKATMFVWAPVPEGYREMGSVEFCRMLLKEGNVAMAPGAAFGPGGENHVRMALVENEQRIRQAVRQVDRALQLRS